MSHFLSPEVLFIEVVLGGYETPFLDPDAPGLRKPHLKSDSDMVLGIPHAYPKG